MTDEHIVPLSLGGQHVIYEASCDTCSKITAKFEQDVAREMWGDARTSYNAPTRRKKQRKTHIILADPENHQRRVKVPYNDYPAPFVFYKMARAGLLEGLPKDLDISNLWKLEAISDNEKCRAFEQKYGIPFVAKFRHVPISFARMIAKIGYGHVLTFLNPDEFRPICVPYILGSERNLSYLVGSAVLTGAPDTTLGYSLGLRLFGTLDRVMLVATVRLLANNSTPTYHVVVGDVAGREAVARTIAKIGPGELRILTPPGPVDVEPSREEHWLPISADLPFWRQS